MALGIAVKYEYFILIEPKSTPLYALVDFGDNGTAIIPFSRIVKGRCQVNWSDGKEYAYDASLTFTGKNYSNN